MPVHRCVQCDRFTQLRSPVCELCVGRNGPVECLMCDRYILDEHWREDSPTLCKSCYTWLRNMQRNRADIAQHESFKGYVYAIKRDMHATMDRAEFEARRHAAERDRPERAIRLSDDDSQAH